MIKVFIDGSQGTTGLRLKDRLMERKDIELLTISEEERKSLPARAQKVAEADVAFLCLPDAASRELVETVKDVDTKIIDTSTAFRCDDRWAYGFPELGISFLEKTGKCISGLSLHMSDFINICGWLQLPADFFSHGRGSLVCQHIDDFIIFKCFICFLIHCLFKSPDRYLYNLLSLIL